MIGKIWVITCMCGDTWAMENVERKLCNCGATLIHNISNHTCVAEVDEDYDLGNKEYSIPYIYEEEFELNNE